MAASGGLRVAACVCFVLLLLALALAVAGLVLPRWFVQEYKGGLLQVGLFQRCVEENDGYRCQDIHREVRQDQAWLYGCWFTMLLCALCFLLAALLAIAAATCWHRNNLVAVAVVTLIAVLAGAITCFIWGQEFPYNQLSSRWGFKANAYHAYHGACMWLTIAAVCVGAIVFFICLCVKTHKEDSQPLITDSGSPSLGLYRLDTRDVGYASRYPDDTPRGTVSSRGGAKPPGESSTSTPRGTLTTNSRTPADTRGPSAESSPMIRVGHPSNVSIHTAGSSPGVHATHVVADTHRESPSTRQVSDTNSAPSSTLLATRLVAEPSESSPSTISSRNGYTARWSPSTYPVSGATSTPPSTLLATRLVAEPGKGSPSTISSAKDYTARGSPSTHPVSGATSTSPSTLLATRLVAEPGKDSPSTISSARDYTASIHGSSSSGSSIFLPLGSTSSINVHPRKEGSPTVHQTDPVNHTKEGSPIIPHGSTSKLHIKRAQTSPQVPPNVDVFHRSSSRGVASSEVKPSPPAYQSGRNLDSAATAMTTNTVSSLVSRGQDGYDNNKHSRMTLEGRTSDPPTYIIYDEAGYQMPLHIQSLKENEYMSYP